MSEAAAKAAKSSQSDVTLRQSSASTRAAP